MVQSNTKLKEIGPIYGDDFLVLRAIGPIGHWSYQKYYINFLLLRLDHWSYGPLVLRTGDC